MGDKAAETGTVELVRRCVAKAGSVKKLSLAVGVSDRAVRFWRAGRVVGAASLADLREYVGDTRAEQLNDLRSIVGVHQGGHVVTDQADTLRLKNEVSNLLGPQVSIDQVGPLIFKTFEDGRREVSIVCDWEIPAAKKQALLDLLAGQANIKAVGQLLRDLAAFEKRRPAA